MNYPFCFSQLSVSVILAKLKVPFDFGRESCAIGRFSSHLIYNLPTCTSLTHKLAYFVGDPKPLPMVNKNSRALLAPTDINTTLKWNIPKMALSDLNGKVFVLANAGSDIGRETAIRPANYGARLALCDDSPELLPATIAQCKGSDHVSYSEDIRDATTCNDFVRAAYNKFGHFDGVCIFPLGTPRALRFQLVSDFEWNYTVHYTLMTLLHITRACIPHMSAGSAFVNMASTAGLRPFGGFAAFCTMQVLVKSLSFG